MSASHCDAPHSQEQPWDVSSARVSLLFFPLLLLSLLLLLFILLPLFLIFLFLLLFVSSYFPPTEGSFRAGSEFFP